MTEQRPLDLDDILNAWRREAKASGYSVERAKGRAFEDLCIVYMEHDPIQSTLFEAPVPYAAWAREHGRSEADLGIDLVAKVLDGDGWCAIQCKFWAEGKRLSKSSIDSFVAASGSEEFSRRILIDTAEGWNRNAEAIARTQSVPVVRIGIGEMRKSPIKWGRYVRHGVVERRPRKSPRPHQEEAILKAVNGLAEPGSRGKLIMACGTGKTFTSLRIAEKLGGPGGRVLYLVPSLALMSQTVREWAADATIPLRSFAVCSDSQVGVRRYRNDDRIDMDVLDLAFPATTEAVRFAKEASPVAEDRLTVVFATYHSLPVIGKAQRVHGLPDFDLTICDEAHRTAGARLKGKEESHFVQIHSQENIRANRRLYMTATPKVYKSSARDKAGKLDAELCSMEDKAIYGPVLFELGFGRAVENGLLTDYKVVVLTVPEDAVPNWLSTTLAESELKLETGAKLSGCWRALAKVDQEEYPEDDQQPMRRAIAYCRDIKSSKQVEDLFESIASSYRQSLIQVTSQYIPNYGVRAAHVDGHFNARRRGERISWLDSVRPDGGACHVLSNARCLAEGVDVPDLDAILFMHPRKSQIDVVQAVGRVMRRASGKRMGYVILPVAIPAGTEPQAALNNSKTFQVVWQVLNAIRSHDERFEALLNLIEEGQEVKNLSILAVSDWQAQSKRTGGGPSPQPTNGSAGHQTELEFDLPASVRAKIVDKCGNRRYWDEWAIDVAKIAQRHINRIKAMVTADEAAKEIFEEFVKELQDDLNEGVSWSDAIEMLAQHMVTRPVFEALHGDARFVSENPVSKGMQLVLDVLKPANIETEAEGLEEFYGSVARRARAANTLIARQKIITELYDKFFRNAFPTTAAKLGIVYTPIEIVDFILHSVDEILREEFGQSLSSPGVQILDPFTGTGTFVTRIIQNGLIRAHDLPRKYQSEIHANEIMLLAYYIAAVNIESAYHAHMDAGEYLQFPGIILTDTFEMQEKDDLIAQILPDNSEQRKRQKAAPIQVIVGNPPWSVGQRSENDAAQNQSYPQLDKRIANSFAHYSTATSKNSLYDSYIRAIRWASDRIGDSGVIGFVTNAGWIDGNAADGVRKCLADEFSSIHVVHLRGNQRTQGELSRREGGKVFGAGSRAAVAITLLVRNPERSGCRILFHDIGDYLNREEKLERITSFRSTKGIREFGGWSSIIPNDHHDWVNQRDPGFANFMVVGDKSSGSSIGTKIFRNYSRGIASARDAWCYNYSQAVLHSNVDAMIRFYNEERVRLRNQITGGRKLSKKAVTDLVNNDPKRISWTSALKNDLRRNRVLGLNDGRITYSQYRPFTRQSLFFGRRLNERVYQIPKLFPHADARNRLICVTGKGVSDSFSCLMVKDIPDLGLVASGQCFPQWVYSKRKERGAELFVSDDDTDNYGYSRERAINETAVSAFQRSLGQKMGGGGGGGILCADDLFYYIYAVLHVPAYRSRYAANLKKELPRIPPPQTIADFHTLASAGRALGDLHVNYVDAKPWVIDFEKGGWHPPEGIASEDWFRVRDKPMRHVGNDRSRVKFNEHIVVSGIPTDAYDYMINGKPAIKWVMERQRVFTHKDSGIVNDANRYALETMHDPSYPLQLMAKVIHISMETNKIVEQLPEPEWNLGEDWLISGLR